VGRFYTNVTVRAAERAQVEEVVRAERYRAWISPTVAGLTVVCESQSERQNLNTLYGVAQRLSLVLNCPALAVMNHDDSVLLYALYDRGGLIDQYDSNPDSSKLSSPSLSEGLRMLATIMVFVLTKPFPSFQPLVDKVAPQFKPTAAEWKSLPSGGDAQKLCEFLGMPGDAAEVERVLRSVWRKAGDEFLFKADQHRALIKALGWPADEREELDLDCIFHAGFGYFEDSLYGNLPPGWLKVA
jgi:hypothetical protein